MKTFCGIHLRVVAENVISFNFFKHLCEKLVKTILRETCTERSMKKRKIDQTLYRSYKIKMISLLSHFVIRDNNAVIWNHSLFSVTSAQFRGPVAIRWL